MSDKGAAVAVNGVTRRFRSTVAIDEVSLDVKAGELFGVLGPDGAGKTTLLRMVAAVLNPSKPDMDEEQPFHRWLIESVKTRLNPPTGYITVGECDTVADAEQVKANLGYMPQNFGLYGDLSVDENLAFSADVFGVSGETRAQRIGELLEFTDLVEFRDRRARLLSGGMKKKLALACALLHRPALLLLDEPTTGVDPVARRDFWDLLSGLHAEGVTTIVTTPYMDEAERCNRVALLFKGRILAQGAPEEIKAKVPGQVLALQGGDMRAAQEVVEGLPALLRIQPYGDQLNLIVESDIDEGFRVVKDKLDNAGIEFDRLEPVPVRMEEAFIYLVSQARISRSKKEETA